MFDWARALADCPLPKGKRVAVLTNAGGPGVIAADALELNGLVLADLEAANPALVTPDSPTQRVGGAVLSVGAWMFMLSVFAGGYAFAWFVRRQWS